MVLKLVDPFGSQMLKPHPQDLNVAAGAGRCEGNSISEVTASKSSPFLLWRFEILAFV